MAAVLSPRTQLTTGTAPWNEPDDRPIRPHLRLVEGGRSGRADRGATGSSSPRALGRLLGNRTVLTLVAGVALAGLVALASFGAIRFLGADAAASGPASTTESLHPAGAGASTPLASAEVVVQPGDTLWAIARRLQPTGDIRPLVDELAQRAGGAVVVSGQRLDVRGLSD